LWDSFIYSFVTSNKCKLVKWCVSFFGGQLYTDVAAGHVCGQKTIRTALLDPVVYDRLLRATAYML